MASMYMASVHPAQGSARDVWWAPWVDAARTGLPRVRADAEAGHGPSLVSQDPVSPVSDQVTVQLSGPWDPAHEPVCGGVGAGMAT